MDTCQDCPSASHMIDILDSLDQYASNDCQSVARFFQACG